MAVHLQDPRYGASTKTLHDLILLVLSKEYPLRGGEIKARLQRQFDVSVSVQAVHKALQTLKERSILEEEQNRYKVRKEYVLEIKGFAEEMAKSYFPGDARAVPLRTREGHSERSFEFATLVQADKFWSEVVLEWARNLPPGEDKRFFFHGPHCWYVFGHLVLERDFLEELHRHGIRAYYLVDGQTGMDASVGRFYVAHHVRYAIGKGEKKTQSALGVFGSSVIQFEYPAPLLKRLDAFFAREGKDDLARIADILGEDTKIILSVLSNKTIAEKLKDEIFSRFPQKK
jgi:hypothetical protein